MLSTLPAVAGLKERSVGRLGLALAACLCLPSLIVLASGCGSQTVGHPAASKPVVTVEGAPPGMGTVTLVQFRRALAAQAFLGGLARVPQPGDPQYPAVRGAALTELITTIWIEGHGEELGTDVSDREIARYLRESGGEARLEEAGFTPAMLREHARAQLLNEKIEEKIHREEDGPAGASFHQVDEAFLRKWRARTHCAKGYVLPQCSR